MINGNGEISSRAAAKIAGWGYIAIFVLAIFGNFFVRSRLVDPTDAAVTVGNVLDSESLFRSGVAAFIVVFALDVLIAWALYLFFRAVSRDVSLLAAWLRLAYTVLLGVALIGFFTVLELVTASRYADALGTAARDAHTQLSAGMFDSAWLIGLALFGIHLIVLGFLVARSGFMPRALGYVLAIAGAAYLLDTFANALLPNYSDLEEILLVIVVVPAVVGELWLALWLLLRGGRTPDALPEAAPARTWSKEVTAS